MAILDVENQNLRRRVRELETALRHAKETHKGLTQENHLLRQRIEALERQLTPGADGREHERIAATFRVDGVNSRGEVAMGIARNISLGGAFIETDLHLRLGEVMTITFELLGQPFKMQAEVIREIEGGFGVRFCGEQPQQAILINVLARL